MISRSTLTFSPGAAGPVLAAPKLDAPAHWGQRARCGEVDPDLFFDETPEGVEAAKAICSSCPAKADCLTRATLEGYEFGVWGGATPEERGTVPVPAEEPAPEPPRTPTLSASEFRQARMAAYADLRREGLSATQAAGRLGLHHKTGRRYEAALGEVFPVAARSHPWRDRDMVPPRGDTGKRCSLCKAIKARSAFHSSSQSRDGLRSECRDCLLERQRERRHAAKIEVAA